MDVLYHESLSVWTVRVALLLEAINVWLAEDDVLLDPLRIGPKRHHNRATHQRETMASRRSLPRDGSTIARRLRARSRYIPDRMAAWAKGLKP